MGKFQTGDKVRAIYMFWVDKYALGEQRIADGVEIIETRHDKKGKAEYRIVFLDNSVEWIKEANVYPPKPKRTPRGKKG